MEDEKRFKRGNEDQAWTLFACAALTKRDEKRTPAIQAAEAASVADAMLVEFRSRSEFAQKGEGRG